MKFSSLEKILGNYPISRILVWLLLLSCLLCYAAIPFYKWNGLDFQNIHAFHNCVHSDMPYLINGADCRDWGKRAMFYPPVLYWSFIWTRGFTFETAYTLWVVILTLSMLGSFLIWWRLLITSKESSGKERSLTSGAIFWLVLLGCIPFIFAVERGNTDCFVVLLWSFAALFFVKKRWLLSGFLAGYTTLFKLYPAFPVVLIVLSWGIRNLFQREKEHGMDWRSYFLFCFGGVLSVLIFVLPLWKSHYLYFSEVLPYFATVKPATAPYAHSTTALDELIPGLMNVGRISILLAWLFAFFRRIYSSQLLLLAGGLALSTSFSATSYDYNLVTCYPLLLLLFFRANSRVELLLAAAAIAVFMGDRYLWFTASGIPQLRVAAITLWLVLFPCLLVLFPSLYRPEEIKSNSLKQEES